MIPSMENLFKRGADLYYSRRHSYPLFEIEFRPGVDGEWIYEVTIRGNSGKVAQYRCTDFNDEIIVSMVESLLSSEDMANIEAGLFQREYSGEIRNTGDRVHIEPMGNLVYSWARGNTITINRPTSIDFDPEEEV